ncbi:MAG: hypothetical protein WCA35_14955, partial [Kovacikia sp.]
PDTIVESLKEHLQRVKRLHLQDLEHGYGSVYLPFALDRKYPNTSRGWVCPSNLGRTFILWRDILYRGTE